MFKKNSVARLAKYMLVGASTFLLDLAILYLLTDVFLVHYVWSAGISFLLAISLNYSLSRAYVFRGSQRQQGSSYLFFVGIAFAGLVFVTGGMYTLVEHFGMHYIGARIIVAGVTGLWNYLMNLHFNFKVVGQHL